MHFEVLVEDLSGKDMLDILIPKIIGVSVIFEIRFENSSEYPLLTCQLVGNQGEKTA